MLGIAHIKKLNKYFKSDYSGSFKAILKSDCIEIKYICNNIERHEVTISYEDEYGGYCLDQLNTSNKNMPFNFIEGIINVLKEVDEREG